MKVCIVGAGSSYTPELFEKMAEIKERFPVDIITLTDIDAGRLEAVEAFCRRYAKHLNLPVTVESTTDLKRAVEGADFVNTQIRVGGNASRVKDERIPLSMDVIGQETTGPGGFMKALRTVPAMLEIARTIEGYAPKAWLINYSNPTGIVSQALHDNSPVRCVALCAGGLRPAWRTAEVLGVSAADVQYDIFGLNHLNYAYNIKVKGRPLTEDELTRVAANVSEVSAELSRKIGAVPSGYLQYYYHRNKKLQALQTAPKTRGEQVLELEKEIYVDFKNPQFEEKPPSLKKRGGGGYSAVAMGAMDAIWNNRDTWAMVNVPNQGTFKCLPDNAVVETGVLMNANGLKPLAAGQPPKAVWGLVAMVKNYEMLTAEAAVTGNKDTAVLALTHHPLVGDYDLAEKLFGQMLEANRELLPQFK